MDWNNDGRVDAHDYAHYKSVIDTSSSSSSDSNHASYSCSYFDGSITAKWIVGLITVYYILKLMGLD